MTANDWLSLVVVLVCLLLSAFFAGSETALTASSRASMARLEKHGNRRAGIVNRLLEQRERLIGALLFGNNAVNIAASALATGVLLAWFGDAGVVYATVVMTVVVVVFSEVLPKTAAFNAPDRIALAVARPMYWFVKVFGPVLMAIEALVRWLLKLIGMTVGEDQQVLSAHEELRGAVDLLHREGGVEKLDRDMFGGVLDLRELAVSDVMIHRTNMITLERRRSARGRRQRGDRLAGDADAAVARQAGEHRRHPARQGSAARAARGRRRRLQGRHRRAADAALVRARHAAGVGAAQGVPPPQDAVRAGGRRIWRGRGPGHARGHSGGDRRRHHRRARRRHAGRARASRTARSMSTARCRSAISTA